MAAILQVITIVSVSAGKYRVRVISQQRVSHCRPVLCEFGIKLETDAYRSGECGGQQVGDQHHHPEIYAHASVSNRQIIATRLASCTPDIILIESAPAAPKNEWPSFVL